MRHLRTYLVLFTVVGVLNSLWVPNASAEDLATVLTASPISATVEKKYFGGRTELSEPLWTGNIPTAVSYKRVQPANEFRNYRSFAVVRFSIQSLVPFSEASNAYSALNVKFELWTLQGEKVAEHWVSGKDWNPLGGPTVVRWSEVDVWDLAGSYNLIVKTHKIIDTDGLISLYQDGIQTLPFVIRAGDAPQKSVSCVKGKQQKVFNRKNCPSGWKPSR